MNTSGIMQLKIIETDRLQLILLTPTDIAYIFANYSIEDVQKLFGFKTHAEYMEEKYKSDNGYTTFRTKLIKFLLVEKSTGTTIGTCSLHNWYPADSRSEIGYKLYREEHRKKGYMSEAVARIIFYGFEELNLNRIEAWAAVDNLPSLRLLERNNFISEGLLQQRLVVDGKFTDTFMFALLRGNYRQ